VSTDEDSEEENEEEEEEGEEGEKEDKPEGEVAEKEVGDGEEQDQAKVKEQGKKKKKGSVTSGGEKQLRNQFNFSERASQTLNNPCRVRRNHRERGAVTRGRGFMKCDTNLFLLGNCVLCLYRIEKQPPSLLLEWTSLLQPIRY